MNGTDPSRLGLTVQAMLTEYQQLRTEMREIMQRQYTMLNLIVTTLGVVLGIGIKIYQDLPEEKIEAQGALIAFVFCLLIPGMMAFLGALWLDGVYRQTKIGTYISVLERKLNALLGGDNAPAVEIMGWERWNCNDFSGNRRSLLFRINYYQYYISLGLFLVVPPLSILMSFHMVKGFPPRLILCVGAACYVLFWLFAAVYIRRIESRAKEITAAERSGPESAPGSGERPKAAAVSGENRD